MPANPFFFQSMQGEITQSSVSSSALLNNASALGIVFIKSFFCALLKKAGLDQASVLHNCCSPLTYLMIDALLVLAFSWLCASLFGYSLLFSLAMESTNHVLRRTDNAHWIMASSPAFYAPGIVLSWVNDANSMSDDRRIWRYMEHGLRSSVSGFGGLMGWLLANQLGPKKIDPKTYFKQFHRECVAYLRRKPSEQADRELLKPTRQLRQ